ncbi:hypothetical protein RB2501_06340 [Robiginitalea biformata HTCC2501]|uniref:Uncharacterized protein n=1 Tax=Robiginitalea biformata (strain ATCC BAA-864 / DSM 15991 / KCTC 12146 / HTCC2501) TaxID=313596 RepID=A4CHT8_ROBBH|nr:hypothetical protein RB2501_06340 [Robiginitalea biformata HTCC2501]
MFFELHEEKPRGQCPGFFNLKICRFEDLKMGYRAIPASWLVSARSLSLFDIERA